MSNPVLTPFVSSKQTLSSGLGTWQRLVTFYARFALGAAFLSAVAARFGLWGENTGPDSFKHFIEYTGEVNSFMPAFTVPFLAWAATVTETGLGMALVLGIGLASWLWLRPGCWLCLAPPWPFRSASNRRWIIPCFPHPPPRCCYQSARVDVREATCEKT